MDRVCPECAGVKFVLAAQQSEYVCADCGWVDPNPKYSYDAPYPKALPVYKKHIARAPGNEQLSALMAMSARGHGAYDRRYYWNERFSQWRNSCPLIPQKELLAIIKPLYTKSDDKELELYIGTNEEELTREEIAFLCMKAGYKKHAEKWIQIKWRSANFPLWKYHDLVAKGKTIPIERRISNFLPEWPWKPDFLPDALFYRLKAYLSDLRNAFDDALKSFRDI
jgi:hypothetical protein